MSLSARVSGTLKSKAPEQIKMDSPEFKFLRHVSTLHRRLQHMEQNKHVKPFFSQAADRLSDRINDLVNSVCYIMDEKQREDR